MRHPFLIMSFFLGRSLPPLLPLLLLHTLPLLLEVPLLPLPLLLEVPLLPLPLLLEVPLLPLLPLLLEVPLLPLPLLLEVPLLPLLLHTLLLHTPLLLLPLRHNASLPLLLSPLLPLRHNTLLLLPLLLRGYTRTSGTSDTRFSGTASAGRTSQPSWIHFLGISPRMAIMVPEAASETITKMTKVSKSASEAIIINHDIAEAEVVADEKG
jgi:hypothetical protein